MTRICVLGNSHTACLKKAWDAMHSSRPDLELVFFAAPSSQMLELVLQESSLCPANEVLKKNLEFTSGGLSRVAIDEYDTFLLMGLHFAIPAVDARCSSAVVDSLLLDAYQSSVSSKLIELIHTRHTKAVYVGSTPMNTVCDSPDHVSYHHTGTLAARLSTLLAGRRLVFLPQPEQTLQKNCFSKPEFSQDAPRLENRRSNVGLVYEQGKRGGFGEHHMNTAYGTHYLEAFFKTVARPFTD
jgi:hypothetical protein